MHEKQYFLQTDAGFNPSGYLLLRLLPLEASVENPKSIYSQLKPQNQLSIQILRTLEHKDEENSELS